MIKRVFLANHAYWNQERSLTALLIYMLLSLFVWIPVSDYYYHWWGFIVCDLLFNLIIIAGVFSVLTRWKKQLAFIIIAVLSSVLRLTSFFTENEWIQLIGYGMAILFFGLLARMVLNHIFKEGPINIYRIQGSVVVFLIIGIVYAFVYTITETLLPGSFLLPAHGQSHPGSFSQFLYFSFVTMTTLGYGDMIPNGSLTKSFVIFQGIIGLLYPVIMIARLISMEVAHTYTQMKK